jgi:4-hydroxybenzoate polyprenyltransferase
MAFIRSLRPYQWSKNLLLAVPPIAAQVWMQPGVLWACLLGIAAFSLAASGAYIINDLTDIDADRRHPDKKHRPFAAGELRPATGLVAGPALLLGGLALAFTGLNNLFGTVLLVYITLALAYSLMLKRLLLVDVIVLAGLYAIRLVAGGAAVGVEVSTWLLAFSMFFFLSIAFAKRLVELDFADAENSGRAYTRIDADAIRIAGPACGLLSILVLALYISSDVVSAMYAEPRWLWLLCLLMLYWILRVWFLAMRGTLHHDPVIFALRDKVSYLVGIGALLALYLASP